MAEKRLYAFTEGYHAARDGEGKEGNPYGHLRFRARVDWLRGWNEYHKNHPQEVLK